MFWERRAGLESRLDELQPPLELPWLRALSRVVGERERKVTMEMGRDRETSRSVAHIGFNINDVV
jgi:hypothetical protein